MAKARLLVLVAMLLSMTGCGKQDETQGQEAQLSSEKKQTQVIVPEEIKGRWKAVKIAVQDKENNKQDVYTVNIGNGFVVGDSDLTLRVENFLPYFQMDGMTLTSVSNDPRNPAAQISISENGHEVFKGWLFSKYPNTHAFQHPRFSFSLVDFVPSG
ncbi:MAG TPA: hypothetical protein VJ995_05570 [Geothermobacteraceae bacterium]|nr:hypothetical protein [Geothermobacteraceae bacterium]